MQPDSDQQLHKTRTSVKYAVIRTVLKHSTADFGTRPYGHLNLTEKLQNGGYRIGDDVTISLTKLRFRTMGRGDGEVKGL